MPLPWVETKMHMQCANSCSLPRVESHTTNAVTMDVMGIMGWERKEKSMYRGQR